MAKFPKPGEAVNPILPVIEGPTDIDDEYPQTTALRQDVRRLLGLDRTYRTLDERLEQIMPSFERRKAFYGINTTTNPRKAKADQKRGIVSEIIDGELLSEDVLKRFPTVYLGSGADIEYPLALGARRIVMVDCILKHEQVLKELMKRISALIGREADITGDVITFPFDFGNGSELVTVEISAHMYTADVRDKQEDLYVLPDQVGLVLGFASQGPGGRINFDQSLESHLVKGGAILEDDVLVRTGIEGRNVVRLGTSDH